MLKLEKYVTVRKIYHTLKICYSKKNGSRLGTRVTDRRMCHFKKCVTVRKMGHKKFVIGRKMCHIWKNGSARKMGHN